MVDRAAERTICRRVSTVLEKNQGSNMQDVRGYVHHSRGISLSAKGLDKRQHPVVATGPSEVAMICR